MNSFRKSYPFEELEYLFSFGYHTQTPITLGITNMVSPETDDFAGRPAKNAHSPE